MSLVLAPVPTQPHGLSLGVVRRFEHQIKKDTVPVLEKLYTWKNLLSFVEQAEELLLAQEQNKDLQEVHRRLSETSVALGESLLHEAGLEEALTQVRYTMEDLKAKVRMLRYKERMWHGDLDSEKSEQVLNSLFHGLS